MRRMENITKSKKGWGIIDLEHPEQYHPWIRTKELANGSGRRHAFADIKYKDRTIHLMSDLEVRVYHLLYKRLDIEELFEQVRLDLDETKDICRKTGIHHPMIPQTQELSIMTTDFVALHDYNGNKEIRAYAVKTSSDLLNQRTLQKLSVEQEYWRRKGIRWQVITENNL